MTQLSSLDLHDPISEGMRQLNELITSEKQEEENKVIPFPKLAIAGGSDGGSGYWLMDTEIGTVFLARPKSDKHNFVCGEFALFEKYTMCACLLSITPQGTTPMHVDMRRFSNQWEKVEVIKIIPQSQLGKPINNDPVSDLELE